MSHTAAAVVDLLMMILKVELKVEEVHHHISSLLPLLLSDPVLLLPTSYLLL